MIGVFDSGIGGLTVVRAMMDLIPEYDIIYLGDTARTPYGSKSAETIIKYSLNNTNFLIRQGAQLIVIACNTASSYAYEAVQTQYDQKGLPIFEVIGPGAGLAVQRSRKLRIGVIGTRGTISSGVYQEKIQAIRPEAQVFATPCPLLVPLVEEGWLKRPETAMIIRKYLRPLKDKQIDTLILGCTHYPVLRGLIQKKIGASVALVDSAESVALQVRAHLDSEQGRAVVSRADSTGSCRIYVTDTAEQFQKTARLIINKPLEIELADL
jgi:glutamate racemase